MSKIFIIGLPRTGTTSACIALLDLGFKVAHCALTEDSLQASDVVGDTPAYCDYRVLDKRFPESRFIYIERRMGHWLPSIKFLLSNMITGLTLTHGGFHPTVQRCYREIFGPISLESITSDVHLSTCYIEHRKSVFEHFQNREESFMAIDLAAADSYQKMASFLGIHSTRKSFPRLNANGKITSWKQIEHKNKVRPDL